MTFFADIMGYITLDKNFYKYSSVPHSDSESSEKNTEMLELRGAFICLSWSTTVNVRVQALMHS